MGNSLKIDGKGMNSMNSRKAAFVAGSLVWICTLVMGLSLAHGETTGEILKATPNHVEIGTVAEGEKVVATAVVQNIGDTPVEITNVRTS
jgi:hypothetical protein